MPDRDPDAREMLEWVRKIVDLGERRPGSPAGLAVERHLAARLAAFGIEDVHLEPVRVHDWRPAETRFEFPGIRLEIPCFPIPYTAWTQSSGVEAACAFVGDGTRADFERNPVAGKIAVFEARFGELSAAALKAQAFFVEDPEGTIPGGVLHAANWLIPNFGAYFEAERRGAVAVCGILSDSPIDGCEHYVPYDGYLKGLPGIWVGRESREALVEAASRGERARLVSRGTTQPADSHNVVGTVPGRSQESIIVTTHHDAPFASAVEDASGLAVLLGLARRFGGARGRLRRHLTFVIASGHFHGGAGNREFVRRHRDGLLRKAVAAFGVEHIAEEAEPDGKGGYRLTGRPEVRAVFLDKTPKLIEIFRRAVKSAGLERTIGVPAYLFGPEPPCDSAPFFTAGIPSACHISGPLYLFDPHDTIDKVRAEDLPRVLRVFEEAIEAADDLTAEELEAGLTRRRGAPPPPPPPWFLPPEAYPPPE